MFLNILGYNNWNFLLCFIFSFLFSFFGIKYFIEISKKNKRFQPIRFDGPLTHIMAKSKVPTMGGLIIVLTILLSIILFCDLKSTPIAILFYLMLGFSFTGFLDDFIKVFFKNVLGFRGSKKLILQLLMASICIYFLNSNNPTYFYTGIFIPVFNIEIPFCNFILAVYVFLITGSANATNITDGLDGLLSMSVIFVAITLTIMAVAMLNGYHPQNFQIERELLYNILIVLLTIISVFGAFLYYNSYPAEIFMGDVGSLMIGAVLCYISILLKVELLFGIMSLLFVWEILSTVLQATCLLLTKDKKRIFKMAPFHHHLEKCGWSEKKVVFSMWCFCLLCCVISLILFMI